MKKLLILLFLTVNVITSQNVISKNTKLKPGIYLSLESIINNQPVEYSNLIVFEKEYKRKVLFKDTEIIKKYHLNMTKEETERVIGIWGFCDGKNIYISSYPKDHPNGGNFYDAEIIGDFIYYEAPPNSRTNFFFNSKYIIDLNKRKFIKDITPMKFKKILSRNPTLLKEFKKEKKKHLLYREYLSRL